MPLPSIAQLVICERLFLTRSGNELPINIAVDDLHLSIVYIPHDPRSSTL